MLKLNRNTKIIFDQAQEPVKRAAAALQRDIKKTCLDTAEEGIRIILSQGSQQKDCFEIFVREEALVVEASMEMGFVYGLYRISNDILGIPPFWFWNDQLITPHKEYPVGENFHVVSTPYRVQCRGWFINDEVLLHTWSVNRRKEEPWEMAFEALLRLGGNLIIPGTDRNARLYRQLALDMGLILTQHHSEPLGAEMFARAYPGMKPSYDENTEKYHQLWRDAVETQKHCKVIWNLGFRGQGDYPFWENDPRYQTEESRGELMGRLIRMQYDMVKKEIPDAVCSTNLYGETMELYKKGFLELPEDVIKIWADNGFGKMVTRRQENHNPRIYSLPEGERKQGQHGIYYHVSFYDLQAANHMTMLPNSVEFVKKELTEVLKHGADDFWIINCSNIKPHVYYLDFIAQMWRDGDVDVEKHRRDYVRTYYEAAGADSADTDEKECLRLIGECLRKYPEYALAYGSHEDEHAGEQFSNHVARILISQYMKNSSVKAKELLWATNADTLEGQVSWYEELCYSAVKGYEEYLGYCEATACELTGRTKVLFEDSILLQVKIHYHCFEGAYRAARAIRKAMAEEYQKAFYEAGKSRTAYLDADRAMREREHGKWHGFYENECLADMKQSAWVMEGFMSYVRNMGDGPHFYQWQRDFLYSEEDRRVMLVMNMENHLKDQEIFALMEEKWDE